MAPETRSSPCDTACSEVPGSCSVLPGSSPITAPFLFHKHTRSKGPFLRRHYPASSVVWPSPTPRLAAALSDDVRRRDPRQPRASPTRYRSPSLHAVLITPVDRTGARWLTSRAFQRRFLPCPCCLPRFSGGSASTSSLSRPAQALLALRPAGLLTHLSWALSRGFALAGFPARTLASYQVQPTTS